MEDLSKRLVDKSIEAFIMGLEIYNKPTIKYRIEGFSFFICNAWELMLKAYIINNDGEEAIYFKDSKDRTISLENAVETVFPDKHGSLRKNLIRIIELRNTSTHFITEDYEHIYAPLFQANVLGFSNKLREFHGRDISDYISQNFLTLSVRLDHLTEVEIRGKYSAPLAEKYLREAKDIEQASKNLNAEFSIPIDMRIYITKDKNDADLLVAMDKNSDVKANYFREVKDPNNLFPYRRKDIVTQVNKKLKISGILLTKQNGLETKQSTFTTKDFDLFVKFYGIKGNENLCFYYKVMNQYSYSPRVVDFLVERIVEDPENVVQNLKEGIKK